jgi:hypothetical protein
MADSRTAISRYNYVVGEVCKKRISILIRKEQYERNKDYEIMENHLYQCIYDTLRSDIPEPTNYQHYSAIKPR